MATETRTPLDDRVARTGLPLVVALGLVAAGLTALGVHRGAGPLGVVVVVVVAVALGAAVAALRGGWSLLTFVASTVGGMSVLRWTTPALAPAWLALLLLGVLVGTRRRWTRQQAARPPAVPATVLRTVHDEGPAEVEVAGPTEADVRRCVEALDGRTRTGVSVVRGVTRLDVGGDAAGTVVVFQCDDTTVRLPLWSVVTAGRAGADAAVDVRVAGIDAHLPGDRTTGLGPALVALEEFVTSGRRAPDLPWRTAADVEDLRAVFERWS